MKKIILVLLVLLCGMSLFAETYTFYIGDRTGKHGYYGGLASKGNLTDNDFEFTKIIQTINNLYEVELTDVDKKISYTYQVKKGDILLLRKNYEDPTTRDRKRIDKNFLVTDIKPNQITLQEQE